MRKLLLSMFTTLSFAAAPGALAHDYKIGSLSIVHPWARATPAGAPVAGGYMTLSNSGAETDRLVGGSAEFAERVEIHEMSMANGMMTMRELARGLEIRPGEKVELKPGSYHIMFMGLKRQLKEGERLNGSLVFERAGSLPVEFKSESMGARQAPGQHHGHGKGRPGRVIDPSRPRL
jgi:copper(I)-binding protein